jgi:hypothetical protein
MNPEELIETGTGPEALSVFLGIIPVEQTDLPSGIKRVGWSQNIGQASQQTAGWAGAKDILQLAEGLHIDSAERTRRRRKRVRAALSAAGTLRPAPSTAKPAPAADEQAPESRRAA